MPKKISIKCVDGSRFDYTDKCGMIEDDLDFMDDCAKLLFIGFPVEGGFKYFNRDNVVSITVKEADDA